MNISQYQLWAASRLKPDTDNKETLMVGLMSEVGELASERMREMRPDREAKGDEEILSELGDIQFYICNLANLYGFTMADVLDYNIQKLETRGVKKH